MRFVILFLNLGVCLIKLIYLESLLCEDYFLLLWIGCLFYFVCLDVFVYKY